MTVKLTSGRRRQARQARALDRLENQVEYLTKLGWGLDLSRQRREIETLKQRVGRGSWTN